MAALWGGCEAELVDSLALHVVDRGTHSAFHFAETDVHFAVVGIRKDVDFGLGEGILDTVERTDKPVPPFDALGFALIVGRGADPNGVFHIVEHIHTAFLPYGMGSGVWLK